MGPFLIWAQPGSRRVRDTAHPVTLRKASSSSPMATPWNPHTHQIPWPWAHGQGQFSQSGRGRREARRPSGLQEPLRHKVKVPEGSLLASGEGTLGCRWGQGWRQAGELPLKVAKVCRATESGHKGRPDSASKQGLPVGGLRTRMESLRGGQQTPGDTQLSHLTGTGDCWVPYPEKWLDLDLLCILLSCP